MWIVYIWSYFHVTTLKFYAFVFITYVIIHFSVLSNRYESLLVWSWMTSVVLYLFTHSHTHTHTHTHNGMKWNRVCLGVCYVSGSVVHCFSAQPLLLVFSAGKLHGVFLSDMLSSFRCICGASTLKSCTTGMNVISGSYLWRCSLENSGVGLTKALLDLKRPWSKLV